MAGEAATLDKISGYFFLTGFLLSKVKNVPILFLAAALNLISLVAYLIGYVAWFLATLVHPNHPRNKEAWYGFAEFKEQYKLAAILGTVATVFCLGFPSLVVPALWIFSISNAIWTVAEFHKLQLPPKNDEHYSTQRQSTYMRYAVLVTLTSVITAIGSTLTITHPHLAYSALLVSNVVSNILTLVALYYFKKCVFEDYKPDPMPTINHSHDAISQGLSYALNQQAQNDSCVEPVPVHVRARAVQRPAKVEPEGIASPCP